MFITTRWEKVTVGCGVGAKCVMVKSEKGFQIGSSRVEFHLKLEEKLSMAAGYHRLQSCGIQFQPTEQNSRDS